MPVSAEVSLERILQLDEAEARGGQLSFHHAKLLSGNMWQISMPFPNLNPEQVGDTILTVGPVDFYASWSYSGTSLGVVSLLEGPAEPLIGDPVTPRNANRALSDDNPPFTAVFGQGQLVAVEGEGILLQVDVLPGSAKTTSGGGDEGSNIAGFLLKANTRYLYRIKCYAAQAGTFAVSIRGYV